MSRFETREIPNEGSTARDHLANERTYLAWIRTGLGSAALGIAVAKLIEDVGTRTRVAGALFVAIGLLALLYGTGRFYRTQRALDEGRVSVDGRGPLVLTVTSILLVVVAAVLVLL